MSILRTPHPQGRLRRAISQAAEISPMAPVLALALALRVGIALRFWNVVAYDEMFQFLEQAHRLVFHQGIVPWEFQVGLRSWLVPLLLAAPMELARLADPDPIFGLAVIRILLCLASLSIVWCAVRWGERFGGRHGGWIAGLVAALWPDLWLMAPHPLEETLSAYALVPAVYLITCCDDVDFRVARRRVAWAGFLLGLAFTLRIQLAPAIAIAGIVLCGRDLWRWRAALLAAALPVLIAGMLDWVTWGQPFRSFWLNVYLNVFLHVASHDFGGNPGGYFLFMLAMDWLWALPVAVILAWQARRVMALPAGLALVVLLTHSLIAHKEFRFVFPAVALAVPVFGIGLALLPRLSWRVAAAAVMFTGVLASPWPYFILQLHQNAFRVFNAAAALHPRLVSVENWDQTFMPLDITFATGGRLTDRTVISTAAGAAAADVLVATLPLARVPAGFTQRLCVPGNWVPWVKPAPPLCLWQRGSTMVPASQAPGFDLGFPRAARPYTLPRMAAD